MLSKYPVIPTLGVKDLKTAKEFYEKTLGFTASSNDKWGALYECGGGTSFLVYESRADVGGTTHAGFHVENLDAEMTQLRAKGVKFEEYDFPGLKTENGVATWDGTRSAWFKDPDGNIIAIDETK